MKCEVEVTDEFKSWWNELNVPEQRDVTAVVKPGRAWSEPEEPVFVVGPVVETRAHAGTSGSKRRTADPDLLRVRPAPYGDLADWRAKDG